MYVVSNLATNQIEGTQKERSVGDFFGANGKFFIPVPPGVPVEVNSATPLFPQTNPNSVSYQIANGFLTRNPNYEYVGWNFFLETNDISRIDQGIAPPTPTGANVAAGYAPVMVPSPTYSRNQIGRSSGPPVGIAPNSVAILPRNNRTTGLDQYGNLVFDTVDLTVTYGISGTDEVLLWWKVARAVTTEDIVNGYGITAGENQPALRGLQETEPDIAGFYAYASVDDGVTWYECKYLTPTDLVTAGKDLRIAFVNESNQKIYLLGLAVLFPGP